VLKFQGFTPKTNTNRRYPKWYLKSCPLRHSQQAGKGMDWKKAKRNTIETDQATRD